MENTQLKVLSVLALLFFSGTLMAQEKLKVAGDARIDGVLKLIKGDDNGVIGLNAGTAITTGSDNTFMGDSTGYANTASGNTFMGSGAGKKSTTAQYNTLIGTRAGSAITTNGDNVMIGYWKQKASRPPIKPSNWEADGVDEISTKAGLGIYFPDHLKRQSVKIKKIHYLFLF